MNLINQSAVDAATEQVLATGIRVFNGALFGANEAEHVAVLLEALNPPEGAMVLDAGCGVGEMARLMLDARPDLDFLLVNTSAAQLAHCPEDTHRLLGDFHDLTDVPDASADAVIFSYAICHSGDWPRALAEARRILKPGGVLLINDMARLEGDNTEFEQVLGARVHAPEEVEMWAAMAGFGLDLAVAPTVEVERMRELLADDELADRLLAGVVPTIWRFRALEGTARTLARHRGRVAFQFSGGRDSTAALYLMRDHWPEMRVYHLDTGDQFPELREVVAQVESDLAAAGVLLERIVTDVHALREQHGYPSDLIPVDNTEFGQMVSGRPIRIQGRYDCCAQALMHPMHERMKADGITLLVRGQRDDEYADAPLRSGQSADGFEVFYPIEEWDAYAVTAYLEAHGLPVAPFYERGVRRAPECMGCTAWWDEGRVSYMRDHHPKEHAIAIRRLADIRREVNHALGWLEHELEA